MALKEYNQKRDFNKTSEPKGKKEKSNKKHVFVVQHHKARKDHYDFRLEWGGVLKSWAVPKGPSYNPKNKRLAVMVEDHPLSYRDFEGVIPKGEYGAGVVMLWDYGTWELVDGKRLDLKNGLIKFKLHGKRLKGLWTLVLMSDNNWLLIKDQDEYHLYDDILEFNTSIKSGKTMEEIKENNGVELTNPDKVIFKNPKVTKKDIFDYYEIVSERMLPFLKNRLISTIRLPDGYGGKPFYKKHFENLDSFLGVKKLKTNEDKRNDYYYIKDKFGLLSEVQMNSYEFHIWGSSVDDVNHADMLVFDLDPDEGLSLEKLRRGVKDLKKILDEYKLESFLKTSGGKGYHVVVPLRSKVTWKNARKIARDIAKLMELTWPDKYTSNMKKSKRKGKIFIDWIRNIKGSTSVAPYSIRLRRKATVSMPIKWSELDKVRPDEITIKEAIKRIRRKDPWENFWS